MADYDENKIRILLYRILVGKCNHSINVSYLKYATKYLDALLNAKVT